MKRFVPIFLATFFLSLHYGATIYVNSTFLKSFFSASTVSLLFILGAVGNIILFLYASKIIERIGKKRLLSLSLLVAALGVLALSLAQSTFIIASAFVIYSSTVFIIYFCLDIFLEELSQDGRTGEIRGLYLTLLSLGVALGPLLVSFFVQDDSLRLIYFVSVFILLIPIIFSFFSFKTKNPKTHKLHPHALLPYIKWWQTKSIRRVTLAKFVLEFFFAIMMVYMPIYLHTVKGFDWHTLGIMFSIMLVPFVIFEWPAGELADRYLGEKELMIIGFLVMIIALVSMPYVGSSIVIWTSILFFSRVGASLVEVMTDSYFFKHVDERDTGLLSIFRLSRPISVVAIPLGALALHFVSYEKLFLLLAVVVFWGLKESLILRDTL